MKTAKTVIMTMIVAFMAIGMTGFAMAGSIVTDCYGDGSYEVDYNAGGSGGDLTIRTHTSDGYDRLHTSYSYGGANVWQRMDAGSTEITRIAYAGGDNSRVDTQSKDVSDNYINTIATSVNGGVFVAQRVEIGSTGPFDYVKAGTIIGACGDEYRTDIYTGAGDVVFTRIGNKGDDDGGALIGSRAGAASATLSGGDIAMTGQIFRMGAIGDGRGVVAAEAYTGRLGYSFSGALDGDELDSVDVTGTHESIPTRIYYDCGYNARGYVYAIDWTASP